MPSVDLKAAAPILSVIAREILALIKSDAALREVQGANAARACYPTAVTVTNAAPVVIPEANSGNAEIFFQMVVVFDGTAGAGRFRIDGAAATPTVGVEIPAGGGTLTVTGHDNIQRFSMIAQGATTMPSFRYLFK